jgi:lipopolysaccharide/colanic/teichoic acid biosynthesis glycosyltransferase
MTTAARPRVSTAHRFEPRRPISPIRPRPRSLTGGESEAASIAAGGNHSPLYRACKRSIDFLGAAVLLVLFSPVLLATLVVLWVTTRGRAIFVQERVGYRGRRFRMFKFRTMVLDATRVQHLIVNEQAGPVFKNRRDPRITRVGRWLRSTSIDELPQLINVLLGQMSLVGPRPPVPAEVNRYQPWQLRRLAIKPGLTCLWQVSGRCEIGFDDWVRMDIWYSNHQSLATDFLLLVKTPLSVLSRRGAY